MANSGYYTEQKLNSGGGGSSLTIREADGTPSGVVTELVFPNGTSSIASGVGTLTLVGDADSRLGVVYDIAEGLPVLSVLDATWSFLNNTYRDNFRTAIDAAAASHTHGNISNAGAIGTTADLPISTTASGVLAARTVADFRGLLGLATTDSPTFAGLTLGTSGILVGGTNLIEQRNGTNGQISRIYKTFTSATNFETFEIDAASDASNYRIGSRIGSAGGTTRGLQLGSYNAAGTWTSWLGIDTSGNLTASGTIDAARVQCSQYHGQNNSGGRHMAFGGSFVQFDKPLYVTETIFNISGTANINFPSAGVVQIGTTANNALGSLNLANITASGTIAAVKSSVSATNFEHCVIDPTSDASNYRIGSRIGSAGGTTRGLQFGRYDAAGAWTSWVELDTSGNATVAASLIHVPPSSVTLSTNGQFSIEMTSDTAGNLVYRGSDGTTRRMALTFS